MAINNSIILIEIESKFVKEKIRKEITARKKQYKQEDLLRMSEEVFSVLEITGVFREAAHICIYNAMHDEVATRPFIDRWADKKCFYLPVIENDNIVLRKFGKDLIFRKSYLGVHEPVCENFTDYKKIDLIIVPGVAFDRKFNRLGRGGGYYDKFLPQLKAPKAGICFDFQLLDILPVEKQDIKMDMIISENELIW